MCCVPKKYNGGIPAEGNPGHPVLSINKVGLELRKGGRKSKAESTTDLCGTLQGMYGMREVDEDRRTMIGW